MQLEALARRLDDFHRDEGGQISFLSVAAIVCFVALLSMVMNTNDVVAERIHMQDVADTTALSAAAWTARGLNTVAFVNVLNAKLIATAVLLNALADTLPILMAIAEVQLAIFTGCSGVPFIGAFCAAMAVIVKIQLTALTALNKIVQGMANKLSRCQGGALLWKMMKTLQTLAEGVRKTFGVIGFAEGISIAKANGANFGVVVNGALANGDVAKLVFLPVASTEFDDFCPFVKNGGPGFELQAYKCNQGPLKLGTKRIKDTLLLPFITLGSKPIFSGMVSSHITQVGCTPDPNDADQKIKVRLDSLADCKKYGATSKWTRVYAETIELTDPNLKLKDFIPWQSQSGTGDASDAEDQGQLEQQLNELGLPVDNVTQPGGTTLGPALQFLKPQEEKMGPVSLSCKNLLYPYYARVGDWNDTAGLIQSFPNTFFSSKPINQWSEFTWVSGKDHVINGPKTAGGYFIRYDRRSVEVEEGEAPRYVYVVEAVSLISAGEKEMNQQQFQQYLNDKGQDVNTNPSDSSTGEGCTKPEPFLLEEGSSPQDREDLENRLRFLSVVYKDTKNALPFWGSIKNAGAQRFFGQTPPRLISYSQGQVYNYLSEDMFSQDWRVRLEHANILESFLSSNQAGPKGMQEPGALGKFIGEVNNH